MSLRLRSLSGNKSESDIFALSESTQDRNKRVIRTCIIFFAVFIVSLFIPVVHFVIPPLCIILGIGFIAKNLRHTQIKIAGTGICPECKKEFPVAELTTGLPVKTFCPHCRNQLYIEKN